MYNIEAKNQLRQYRVECLKVCTLTHFVEGNSLLKLYEIEKGKLETIGFPSIFSEAFLRGVENSCVSVF